MAVSNHVSTTEALFYRAVREFLPSLPFVTHYEADWLRNPDTNRRMHLDIAWPVIKVGLEIQGTHHDRPIRRYGARATEKQRVSDRNKLHLCQKYGWLLLHANIHHLTDERLRRLISQVLDRAANDPALIHLVTQERYHLATRQLPTDIKQPASRFASMGIRRQVRRPYRKPGLLPLLQRTWRRLHG